MHLDTKLNFQEHLHNIMSKLDKSIELLRKLQAVLPRPSLVTIYIVMGIIYITKHTKNHFIKN